MKNIPLNLSVFLCCMAFIITALFMLSIVICIVVVLIKYRHDKTTMLNKIKKALSVLVIPCCISIACDFTSNQAVKGMEEVSKYVASITADESETEDTTTQSDSVTPDNTSVTDNKNSDEKIKQVEEDTDFVDYTSLDIVIVVDQSISMKEYSDPYKITSDATKLFVGLCKNYANCNMSVITFANEPHILFKNLNSKNDYTQIISKINTIEYDKTNTNIFDALNCADEIIKSSKNENSKKMILLISDGENDVSEIKSENEKLRNSIENRLDGVTERFNCPIYTIGLNSGNEKYSVDEQLMIDIANKTGGNYEIIRTNQGLSDIDNEKQNLYLFLTDIINEYMGTKITKSDVIKVNSNSFETIESEKVKYADNGQLIVYGDAQINIDSLNIYNNSDEAVGNKGEHYIIVDLDEPDNQVYKYKLTSGEDVDVRYAFIYNYNISFVYSIYDSIMVGEPFKVYGQLVPDEAINESDITPYLYVLTKEDYSKGKTPKEYKLLGDNGYYYLDDYIFSNTGKYFCRFMLKSNDGSFERGCEYKEINVVDPQVNILSITKNKNNNLNVAFDFSSKDGKNSKRKCTDCFDIEISADNVNYYKVKSNNEVYEAEIPCENSGNTVDIFIKLSLNDKCEKIVDSGSYSNTIVMNNAEIKNSAPYVINGNYFNDNRTFMFFNNNKFVIDLKDYFNDDSSTFNIDYELIESTDGTKVEIYADDKDSKKLLVTSNPYGNNSLTIQVSDAEDPSLVSEAVQIDLNAKIYLSGMGLYLFLGIPCVFLSIVFVYRRKKAICVFVAMNGDEIKKKLFKTTTKVSKLIDNSDDRLYFKNIKIKRLSHKTNNVSIIYPDTKV